MCLEAEGEMSLESVIYEPGMGETLELRGTKVRVLCTAADSVGASTFEFLTEPGFDTGSHYHSKVEEQFYMIDGQMELRVGDRVIAGRAGTFVSIPTGVAHAFANRSDQQARMLIVTTPPGHENYFADLAAILARPGAPNPDEIAALRARYDTIQVSSLST
jgi:uncharacterized cupin superfamily protein